MQLSLKTYIEEAKVSWLLGRIPQDEPDCGFDGERCLTHTGNFFLNKYNMSIMS